MEIEFHMKDLAAWLRRVALRDHAGRDCVVPEYFTGAADHIDALLKDRARLDWLEKEKTDVEYRHGQGALGPGWAVWMDDAKTEKHATARDALDAARKLQP